MRATSGADVAYAAVTWPTASPLTGAEYVKVQVVAAPTASARLSLVGGQGIGGVAAPVAQATIASSYEGSSLNPGTGSLGSLGLRADTAGIYAAILDVTKADGTRLERVNLNFTTRGAPTSLSLSASPPSVAAGGSVTLTTELLDASGQVTQPLAIDGVTFSTNLGTLSQLVVSGAGDPATSLSDGVAQVTLTSASAGAATVVATPTGTLPAAGVSAASQTVNITGGASSSPTPTLSPSPTPTPTPTPSPTPTPTPAGFAAVGPVRAGTTGTIPYAALMWTPTPGVTSGDHVLVDVTTSPTASARMQLVPGTGVGGVGTQVAQATLTSSYEGWALSPGGGLLGIRVDTPGFYAATLEVGSSDGSVRERVQVSFSTRGAPASLSLTASPIVTTVGLPVRLSAELRDAAGQVTQPLAVDTLAFSSTFGTLSAVSVGATGVPASSLSDGMAEVSLTASTAGAARITATPTGTMPAGGVRAAVAEVEFRSGTPTPTPSPTLSPGPTPSPSPTSTPSPSPTSTPTPTPSPTDPEFPGTDESADSLTVSRLPDGKYRVAVTTAEGQTPFRVVASRPGSSVRWLWKDLTTDIDGEFAYRTSRDLAGCRMRLVVDGITVVRISVPGP